MDAVSHLLQTFRLRARVFHNAQYCGAFNIDTSGKGVATFHVVTSGRCALVLPGSGERATELEAGDLVLFPRDQPHRICDRVETAAALNGSTSVPFADGERLDGTGLVCGYLEFDHPSSNPLLDALPDSIVIKSGEPPWNTHLGPLLDVLISESKSDQAGVQVTLNRLTDVLFVLVLRERLASASGDDRGLAAALADERIARALRAMHVNLAGDWTVESLAREAAMSRSAFAAKFSDLLGESPMVYLTNVRMAAAHRWLRDDRLTIADAAERAGYKTEAAFSKAFKRALGVSPGAVRAGDPA